MSTLDLSRNATDPRSDYRGVILQQGRVLVDDDINELERARGLDLLEDRTAIIGTGSPDEGFRIAGPVTNTAGRIDFTIRAGAFYAAGMRLRLAQDATFQLQRSDLQRVAASALAPGAARRDLAWLEAWEQDVAAVEDGELVDPGVGVDTAGRSAQLARVRLYTGIGAADCATAMAALGAYLAAAGQGIIDSEGRLTADATLTVGFVPGAPSDNPCDAAAPNGFRGADNTLIRVQVSGTGLLTWGFDNGSGWYRAQLIDGGTRLRLLTEPRDRLRWPLAGQHAELVPWGSLQPNGEKLAAAEGSAFTTCVGSYDPVARTIAIAPVHPITFGRGWTNRSDQASIPQPLLPAAEREFIYVRLWERGEDAAPAQLPFVVGVPLPLGATGLTVTLAGTQFPQGGHWLIAARPDTPERVTPWALLGGAAMRVPPRHFAALGIIAWTSATVATVEYDCRRTFLPLTRLNGCCTVTVGDGLHSHGRFTRIQDAIAALPAEGGKICVLPGTYVEDVVLLRRRGITIEGCGTRTLLRPATATGAAIRILGGKGIVISRLAIEAPTGFGVVAIAGARLAGPLPAAITSLVPAGTAVSTDGGNLTLTDCHLHVRDRAAVAVFGWDVLTLRGCHVTIAELLAIFGTGGVGVWKALHLDAEDIDIERTVITMDPLPRLAAAALGGIRLVGGCARVRIRDCRISGGAGDGVTLGQIVYVPATTTGASGDWSSDQPGLGYVITGNGCIGVEPDPADPTGPGGHPLQPISTGDITDLSISDTVIIGMGGAGIGVACFFNRDLNDLMIGVHGLAITRCRLAGNLQAELPEMPPTLRDDAAYAAIALALVERFAMTETVVEDNGISHFQAICGVFILLGEDLRLVGNRITGNAPQVVTSRGPDPGIRGGVVIAMALAPTRPVVTTVLGPLVRQSGAAALEMLGNTVIQPFGRALTVVALGPVVVADNRLVTRGAKRAQFDLAALMGAEDVAWQLIDFAAATVAIIDLGLSNEYLLQALLHDAVYNPAVDARRSALPLGAIAADGNVRFHGNQVGLDLIDGRMTVVLSSVLLASLDDVAVLDNQFDADLLVDFVLLHVISLAWSTRVADNRIKEPAIGPVLSGLTFALRMNATSYNQSTHCIYASCGEIAGLADDNNRVSVHLGIQDDCSKDVAQTFRALLGLFS